MEDTQYRLDVGSQQIVDRCPVAVSVLPSLPILEPLKDPAVVLPTPFVEERYHYQREIVVLENGPTNVHDEYWINGHVRAAAIDVQRGQVYHGIQDIIFRPPNVPVLDPEAERPPPIVPLVDAFRVPLRPTGINPPSNLATPNESEAFLLELVDGQMKKKPGLKPILHVSKFRSQSQIHVEIAPLTPEERKSLEYAKSSQDIKSGKKSPRDEGTESPSVKLKKLRLNEKPQSKYVDEITTFIADLFSTDDAFVPDTSMAYSSAPITSSTSSETRTRNPTKNPTQFFCPDQSLTTECLIYMEATIKLIKTKKMGDEFVDEVEVDGLKRLLGICSRTWGYTLTHDDEEWTWANPCDLNAKKLKGKDQSEGGEEEEEVGDNQVHLTSLEKILLSIRVSLVILNTSKKVSLRIFLSGLLNSILTVLKSITQSAINPTNCSSQIIVGLEKSATEIIEVVTNDRLMLGEGFISKCWFWGLESLQDLDNASSRSKSSLSFYTRKLQVTALALLERVLERYPAHRNGGIEEMLTELIKISGLKDGKKLKSKGLFWLSNGTSIQVTSAVILKLVQCVPNNLWSDMSSKLGFSRSTTDAEHVLSESNTMEIQPVLGSLVESCMKEYLEPAMEACAKTTSISIKYLLQRSCKIGKAGTGTTESDYRQILDSLVGDLITVIHTPEWNSSTSVLTALCGMFLNAISETKNTPEINALKGVALDHIGTIAAKLQKDSSSLKDVDYSLQEIFTSKSTEKLDQWMNGQHAVLQFLTKSSESTVYTRALIGQDLWTLYRRLQDVAIGPEEQKLLVALEESMRSLWITTSKDEEDVFGSARPIQESDWIEINRICLAFSKSHSIYSLYHSLLRGILDVTESNVVTLRAKALRALGIVLAQDQDLFLREDVVQTITSRCTDNSPSVRDTVLDLIGKYVITRPDLAERYVGLISERIVDTGLSVRKRVVRLLKSMFSVVNDKKYKIDICKKLVNRIHDEEDTIKELAVDALDEIWFSGNENLTELFSAIAGEYTGTGTPPLALVITAIHTNRVEKKIPFPWDLLRNIVDELVVKLTEEGGELELFEIRTIQVLTGVNPELLSSSKASLLLPFLKGASTPNEQQIADSLLRIFKSIVSPSSKGSDSFSKDLQASLLGLVNKPSPTASVASLQEVISCLALVVRNRTQDFSRLIMVCRICFSRLEKTVDALSKPESAKTVRLNTIPMLCFMTALLFEHSDLDSIRKQHPQTTKEIDSIAPKSASGACFDLLLRLHTHTPPPLKRTILQSIGFLARAYPTLMYKEATLGLFDAIFETDQKEEVLFTLRIVQDFLNSQLKLEEAIGGTVVSAVSVGKGKKGVSTRVKIDELVGNVEDFADSGVASTIAQRYISPITKYALSPYLPLQRIASDILLSIARSGFGHPMHITPALLALSVSSDKQLSSRAFATFAVLFGKHASILAMGYIPSMEVVWRYLGGDGVGENQSERRLVGWDEEGNSRIAQWYGLLKEKRKHQLDFLKTISKHFELDLERTFTIECVSFYRFLAECVSRLEFRKLEEVGTIVYYLNQALAVSGLQVMYQLAPGMDLLNRTHYVRNQAANEAFNGNENSAKVEDQDDEGSPSTSLVFASLICGLALLLRDNLKYMYGLNEDKLSKFTVGKKSTMGDKAISRKLDVPFLGSDQYPRMPLVYDLFDTIDSLKKQRDNYIAMIQSDGTIGEPEDESDLEDQNKSE